MAVTLYGLWSVVKVSSVLSYRRRYGAPSLIAIALGILVAAYFRNVEPESVADVCTRVESGNATLRLRTNEEGELLEVAGSEPGERRTVELDAKTRWVGRCESGQPVGEWILKNRNGDILKKQTPIQGELRVFN